MRLTEAGFTELMAAPCACGGQIFDICSYVDLRQPLLEGEPHGQYAWAYKGEHFVHGTYAITCRACKKAVFEDAGCPKCDLEGGLEIALDAENTFDIPLECPSCHISQVSLLAYVPVRVAYKGSKADRAHTTMRAGDPGFHAYRVECKNCQNSYQRTTPCPLCAR